MGRRNLKIFRKGRNRCRKKGAVRKGRGTCSGSDSKTQESGGDLENSGKKRKENSVREGEVGWGLKNIRFYLKGRDIAKRVHSFAALIQNQESQFNGQLYGLLKKRAGMGLGEGVLGRQCRGRSGFSSWKRNSRREKPISGGGGSSFQRS